MIRALHINEYDVLSAAWCAGIANDNWRRWNERWRWASGRLVRE